MLQLPFSPAIDESLPNLFREETIQSVVSYAKTKPAGSHQLLLKVYPPTFAIVTVNENKQVSLHVVNHDEDPNYPNNLEMASATGFNWHRERVPESVPSYTFNQFKRLHSSTCNKIDKCIEQHHGIS